MPPARAHLEYTLYIRLAEIEPPIWRRIVVPANLTLHQLHQVLQVTMGWTHSHLHQFVVTGTQESIYYGEPSPEDDYGQRACPPEDVGGVSGYANFLEAWRDRSHPEHREMREWVGKHFKPELFSVPQVNAALAFFISIYSKP